MIVAKILDVKKFMAGFLAGTMLDSYRMASGSVTTFCTFRIDGIYHKQFFEDSAAVRSDGNTAKKMQDRNASIAGPSEDGPAVFVSWKDIRPFCFSIVRGKHTPLAFKFVFYYPSEAVPEFCTKHSLVFDSENAPGLCLNLKFDQNGLFLTTGISRKSFSMDRSVDEAWDQYTKARLKELDISFEQV